MGDGLAGVASPETVLGDGEQFTKFRPGVFAAELEPVFTSRDRLAAEGQLLIAVFSRNLLENCEHAGVAVVGGGSRGLSEARQERRRLPVWSRGEKGGCHWRACRDAGAVLFNRGIGLPDKIEGILAGRLLRADLRQTAAGSAFADRFSGRSSRGRRTSLGVA